MRGQSGIAALNRAFDEAMRDADWNRADHPERCDILTRAVCRALAPRSGLRPPNPAALAAALARSDRDRRVRAHLRVGLSKATVARRFNLSVRQIRRIAASD